MRQTDGEKDYRVFSWRPLPEERLGRLALSLQTRSGLIRAAWEIREGRALYELDVPEGTKALVTLPDGREFTVSPGEFRLEGARNQSENK